jgi:UPF0755 protein
MAKSKNPLITLIGFAAILLICLGFFLIGVSIFSLQRQAKTTFGEPDPSLSDIQKKYLTLILLINADSLTQPPDQKGAAQSFKISHDEPTNMVIERLNSQGLIRDSGAFRAYLQYTGLDKTLQAGEYSLSPSMTAIEIAERLQDATPNQVAFNILAGWQIEEIAALLPTSGIEIVPSDFLAAASKMPEHFSQTFNSPPDSSVEGFLLPGSYHLKRKISARELLDTLLTSFENNLTPDLQQGFEKQGLNIYQAVTLASIVEREAVVDDEMPMIASVFLNRLAKGMKLDSDPTVQYALGYNEKQKSWWTNPLDPDDLSVDSLYNTYLHTGLPPGPIANPGLEALRAVAFPAQSGYYYFRVSCNKNGRHEFSTTYQEHLGKSCP